MNSPTALDNISVSSWTINQVYDWLNLIGLAHISEKIAFEQGVDGAALLLITEEDLLASKVLDKIGPRKKLLIELGKLRDRYLSSLEENSVKDRCLVDAVRQSVAVQNRSKERRKAPGQSAEECFDSVGNDISDGLSACSAYGPVASLQLGSNVVISTELVMTLASITYLAGSLFLTSLTMTVVHSRVPDINKYPPLPDIVLDNVPFIPWAFNMSERCALVLGYLLFALVCCHKQRLTLVKRVASISASVFLLRCITMYVTSLSVPGTHIDCSPQKYDDWSSCVTRAWEIFSGAGMALNGVRTCGDYMFSGHTVVLTLTNFFITEYTPRNWFLLHTFCWILNAFGVFFILASHEHYSIDVVVAFYISSRLFVYYHSLTNSPEFWLRHGHRAKVRYPLFYFFEATSPRVGYEYELPFQGWIIALWSWVRDLWSKHKHD